MKLNKQTTLTTVALLCCIQLIFNIVLVILLPLTTTHWIAFLIVINLTFLVLQGLLVLIFNRLYSKQIRNSLRRFIKQIKAGNFTSENPEFFNRGDLVNLSDIQIELSKLVGQIQADYNEQKRYVENVNHELMTPIAVIRGKLELLIQSKNIDKGDFKLINNIMLKLDRLTRVNQSLVLLSKIDYNHYQEKTQISFNKILDETLNLFEDQIRIDELIVRKDVKGDINFKMNENLAFLLIKNIIKNAVIHNVEAGYIRITKSQDGNGLIVINSGAVTDHSTERLFERFQVGGNYSDSIGLGLSIMSKICEVSGIKLSYERKNNEHKVEIKF